MVATDLPGPPAELLARPAEAWPPVTVAILAYERREAVRITLQKVLGELDYPALEAVVVDNASTDGTSEMLARGFPAVRVLRLEENEGVSAWNHAFGVARGEWVLVLDDDCYLEGDGLKRAVAAAQAHAADLVSFRVRSSYDPAYFFNDFYPPGLLAFWGCSWLGSARALGRLRGFDPNIFLWANEAEFTMRLLDEGWRHLFLPEVVAVHMKPPMPRGGAFVFDPRAFALNVRHFAYTAGKNLQWRDALRVLGRLAGLAALEGKVHSREAAKTLPGLLVAFARGLRVRRPVRPEVSAVYRDKFASFASPLEYVRGPAERLRARGDRARVQRDRDNRYDRLFASRQPFYPERTALVEL